ncbi:uncharacterized protein OCT59_019393 [Rhizophagus irregularis]|uniref:uncharacterized protein n=1 Tax=Rhizophagus irregularis TaxID=588596 RepID=UPI0019E0940A|nr:hypothetical protein OCT59_019393 [Rhizophagus irregularis]GBC51325.2 hypothetical protein RIR_jg26003.t1 [Rhizophagus irregularis DAOM 181602=DAOM 197198]
MENVNCKYHIINLFEKNLVKKILGGNETICQRKTEYVKVESVFDDNVQTSSIKVIFKDEFDFKKHYENLWCKISIGNLYASFDDLNDKIRFQIREIESKLCKRSCRKCNG